MTPLPLRTPTENLLTFVFDHWVVSRAIAGSVTLGDIARMRGSLGHGRYGNPVAISVVLGQAGADAPGGGSASRH